MEHEEILVDSRTCINSIKTDFKYQRRRKTFNAAVVSANENDKLVEEIAKDDHENTKADFASKFLRLYYIIIS